MAVAPADLVASYERELRGLGPVERRLHELRRLVCLHGVPQQVDDARSGTSMRAMLWKLFLQALALDATSYLSLVAKGPCAPYPYSKIRNDSFRTFRSEKGFASRVTEAEVIRVQTAFAHTIVPGETTVAQYIQGMNCLSGIFLFVMPELDSFHCLVKIIKQFSPTYWQANIIGAHAANNILLRCLYLTDTELHEYFLRQGAQNKLSAESMLEVLSLKMLLTFCASIPPLSEAIILWDFLLAVGLYMGVVCVLAQIILHRDELLRSGQSLDMVNRGMRLDARRVLHLALQLAREFPEDLFTELQQHTSDLALCQQLVRTSTKQ